MSFIRTKQIPLGSGNYYAYLVESVREGDKVRQKVLDYLGRANSRYVTSEEENKLLEGIGKEDLIEELPKAPRKLDYDDAILDVEDVKPVKTNDDLIVYFDGKGNLISHALQHDLICLI